MGGEQAGGWDDPTTCFRKAFHPNQPKRFSISKRNLAPYGARKAGDGMNEGTVAATFLIVFREALEASLIVGIIMTALARLNQQRYFPQVIGSSILAILVSVAAGFVLASSTQSVQGQAKKMIEGII